MNISTASGLCVNVWVSDKAPGNVPSDLLKIGSKHRIDLKRQIQLYDLL